MATWLKLWRVIKTTFFFFVPGFFLKVFKKLFMFILGCGGSLLLHMGYSLVVVCGLLAVVASPVADQRLQSVGFGSCGTRA